MTHRFLFRFIQNQIRYGLSISFLVLVYFSVTSPLNFELASLGGLNSSLPLRNTGKWKKREKASDQGSAESQAEVVPRKR